MFYVNLPCDTILLRCVVVLLMQGFLLGRLNAFAKAETDKDVIEGPGVPGMCLIFPKFSVKLEIFDVWTATVVVGDPLDLLLRECVRVLPRGRWERD